MAHPLGWVVQDADSIRNGRDTMSVVKFDDVVRWAIESAAIKGNDYVYTNPDPRDSTCLYVHEVADGTLVPGCIVGDMVVRQGVLTIDTLNVLADEAGVNVEVGIESFARYIEEASGRVFTDKARAFLEALQSEQDSGTEWGRAISEAWSWCNVTSHRYDDDENRIQSEY